MTTDDMDNDRTESMGDFDLGQDRPRISRLGHFKIESTLGSGGMGTIYKAYDESMKRPVALKVLHSSLEISEQAQTRFIREAWIAGQLDHPNIIEVYSRGEEKGINYFAMELADAGSLADLIRHRKKTLPDGTDSADTVSKEHINFILEKFVELAYALEQIHSKGFIHRDIKPHNILISGQDKKFKFTDFGIAHSDDMSRMTRAGDFIGTVRYMSPELLTAHRATVDKRTDIYSLGATLYEAISLVLPYNGDSEEKYITEILSGHSIPLRKRNTRIPKNLETVIIKCMHHDQAKRYQSSAELANDLERILSDHPIQAKRESLPTVFVKLLLRNRVLSTSVIVTAIVVASAVWWFGRLNQISRDESNSIAILETVLETGVSPYKIDPEWGRLSEVVFDGLENDPTKETSELLLKCMCQLSFIIMEHCLFETAFFETNGKYIEGITDFAVERRQQGALRQILKKTTFYASLDGGEEKLVGVGEGSMYEPGLGFDFLLKDLVPNVSEGIHNLQLRWETEMYTDSRLSVLRDGQWDDLDQGFYVFRSEPIDSIYDIATGKLSKSFLRFSQQKDFNIWVHEKYPDDFPKRVFDSTLVQLYQSNIKIDTVLLVKVKKTMYRKTGYRMVFLGAIETSLPYPIAAEFELTWMDDHEPIVKGALLVYDGFFGLFDMKAKRYREKQSVNYYQGSVHNKIIIDAGFNIAENRIAFDSLEVQGGHHGMLKLNPSREIAFKTGHYDEYWGGSIEIPVKVIFSVQNGDFY